jgi:muramoyltetrapeptide carboxypeptidase
MLSERQGGKNNPALIFHCQSLSSCNLCNELMKVLKPPRLRKGDVIGVVSPSSPPPDTSYIDRGVRYLEQLGYRVAIGKNTARVHGYLAGTDAERASDVHAMFASRHVKAIMCVRGGYGTSRLLPLLDFRLITRNPKILSGFSDCTALQLGLWRKCRLITFHGPMVGVEMAEGMDPYTEEMLWATLTSSKKPGRIRLPADTEPVCMHPGKASGRLLGGNLSLIVSLLGTPYLPDFKGSVLMVEEIGEEPYRIDRMVTQLRNASVLEQCAAVLSGQFTDCTPKDIARPSFSVDEILREQAGGSPVPFVANLPFGHVRRKLTLPVGLKVTVDASDCSIELTEAAVV